MSESPNIFLDSPDPLSSLLNQLDLDAQIYANGDYCGAWAVDVSGKRHIPFHLIDTGEAWLHMDNAPSTLLSPGTLVVFPRDDKHLISNSQVPPAPQIVNQGSGEGSEVTRLICGYFEFRHKAAWPLLDALDKVIVLDIEKIAAAPYLNTLITWILSELDQQAPGHYAALKQLAHILFIHILRQQMSQQGIQTGLLNALFDPKISLALQAMHNQPQHKWTLESLASTSAMGRSSFAHKFHQLVGVPAMHYLTQWRMQLASRLLKEGTHTIVDIAEKCGYESEAAFRKAFKKNQGITPGQLKRG